MYNPDYLPIKKEFLPGLNNLIYDPYLNNSLFLLYFDKPPLKVSEYRKERQLEILTDKQKKIVNDIQQTINRCRRRRIDETGKIIRFIREVKDFFEIHRSKFDYNLCPSYLVFINMYLKWVCENYEGWGKLTVG